MTEQSDQKKLPDDVPQVTIGEEVFEILPLGIAALGPLARIAAVAGERSDVDLKTLIVTDDKGEPVLNAQGNPTPNPEKIGKFLLTAIGYCEAEVMLLLAQLVGVSVNELRDPKRFPLSAIAQLIGALVRSIDVSAFLAGGQPSAPAGEQ